MQTGSRLRQYLDSKAEMTAFASAPTQNTEAIKPIKITRLVRTDSLPAVDTLPPVKVVHIGSVLTPLLYLNDMSRERILQGYRLACLNQRLAFKDALYVIRDVFWDASDNGKIYARIEREDVVELKGA